MDLGSAGGARSRGAETAGPARAFGELRRFQPGDSRYRGHDQLRDALAAADDERLAAEIDQDDADLAAVVGIDGARRVEHGDARLQREAGAWPHLRFESAGQRYGDSRRYQLALARRQDAVAGDSCQQIEARAVRGRVGR